MKYLIIILILFISACTSSNSIDYEKEKQNVNLIAKNITRLMSTNESEKVYSSLMHNKVKENVSIIKFKEVAENISNKLGEMVSLELSKINISSTSDGWFAQGLYMGKFKNGTGDVTVTALYINNQWLVLMSTLHYC